MSRRGENIYKRKDGRWEGRYIKCYMDGKAKYGYVYAKTYKDVKEKLNIAAQFRKEAGKAKTQSMLRQGEIPFRIFASAWLETIKPQLKDSSIVKYSNVLTVHLFPRFADIPVDRISSGDVLEFGNELLCSGGKKGNGLSPRTVAGILSVLKAVFAYAARQGKIKVADISSFSVRQSQKPMRILSISEQQKLSLYLYGDLTLTNLGILVCLYTGIRIGEICAMKWGDISFEEQCLYVNKTMQRIQNKENQERKTSILITAPKSGCSIRRIPLPDELFQLLAAARCPENAYLLTGQDFFMEPRTMQNRFKRVIRKCNIKDMNFHGLRHTFATRCIELGFDIKSLSEILGHASVNITLNRYVHPSMELKQKNMNMLSELFSVR